MRRLLLLIALPFIAGINLTAQDYHVRIGTIGNSITHGISVPNPEVTSFPARLNVLLSEVYGDTCIVQNYGLTSTTMLKNGDIPYWEAEHFQNYLWNAPEICFIMLGTNDTKPQNWDEYGDEFIGDYLSMIDTIKQRNPHTHFILAYPPPAFSVQWGIRDSVILHGVIPAVDSILQLVDADLIDFYNPLLDDNNLFPDDIHPDEEGSILMAEMLRDVLIDSNLIHEAMADTGYTFITGFTTETTPLAKTDSSTLSWTSINADSVFLNNQYVVSEGSIKVAPTETTTYTLLAKGKLSNDTVSLNQEVYIPELTRLRIQPAKVTRYAGDTIMFKVLYHDQIDREMPDSSYAIEWNLSSVSETGTLFDAADNFVYLATPLVEDTCLLTVSYNDLSDVATIYTRPNPALNLERMQEIHGKLYPNPVFDNLSLKFDNAFSVESIQIYNALGVLMLDQKFDNTKSGEVYNIDVSQLNAGSYFVLIKTEEGIFGQQISKATR